MCIDHVNGLPTKNHGFSQYNSHFYSHVKTCIIYSPPIRIKANCGFFQLKTKQFCVEEALMVGTEILGETLLCILPQSNPETDDENQFKSYLQEYIIFHRCRHCFVEILYGPP